MTSQSWLITGGAGFIGTNAVRVLAARGDRVVVVDNLSRITASLNVDWLRETTTFDLVRADVRDATAVDAVFAEHGPFDVVLHLAGQVAVTTSVADPRDDLGTNVLGSFNVLDATRRLAPEAVYINASTNKVYGQLGHHRMTEGETRYVDEAAPDGIDEAALLDPHSPYGCSKAAADVYTLDYARIYGLRAVSLRQSCIYGPRQFGVEDQGWVAWFAMATRRSLPLTIYGNGKQVRDLLHVDDLIDCYLRVVEHADTVAGRPYNIGGGPPNTMSLVELLARLSEWRGTPIEPAYAPSRAGDQLVFVADTTRAAIELGWRPTTSIDAGLPGLLAFVDEHAADASAIFSTA